MAHLEINREMKIYFNTKHGQILKEFDLSMEEEKGKLFLEKDKLFFENLLDTLSDSLMEKGLKENDEPNEYGLRIEGVIDVISEVYYQ